MAIPKTHDLILLYSYVKNIIKLNEDDLDLLEIATEYYKDNRYPSPRYYIPSKKEIYNLLEFVEYLLNEVKNLIEYKE